MAIARDVSRETSLAIFRVTEIFPMRGESCAASLTRRLERPRVIAAADVSRETSAAEFLDEAI
jgi:hypothetical protein